MTARKKKDPQLRLTAHVGYRPPGKDLHGRKTKAVYHAVVDQDTEVGKDWSLSVITRFDGDALCGRLGPWHEPPDGLFPPVVTCPVCADIAIREHITITGQPDMLVSRP